ncbi:hypothetical protein [Niabella pedocola]|nr:hypothetical protein [Niabella pedocola]
MATNFVHGIKQGYRQRCMCIPERTIPGTRPVAGIILEEGRRIE